MFTMPQNTIAYLHKEPIDMRYGMFRLQGVIARQLREPMPRGAFYFFINKGHSLLKAVWFDGTGLCLCSANDSKKAPSRGLSPRLTARRNGCKLPPQP